MQVVKFKKKNQEGKVFINALKLLLQKYFVIFRSGNPIQRGFSSTNVVNQSDLRSKDMQIVFNLMKSY